MVMGAKSEVAEHFSDLLPKAERTAIYIGPDQVRTPAAKDVLCHQSALRGADPCQESPFLITVAQEDRPKLSAGLDSFLAWLEARITGLVRPEQAAQLDFINIADEAACDFVDTSIAVNGRSVPVRIGSEQIWHDELLKFESDLELEKRPSGLRSTSNHPALLMSEYLLQKAQLEETIPA